MVLDTSAVIAILQKEDESDRLIDAIAADPVRRMSAGSVVEAGLIMQARYGDAGERELDLLLNRLRVDVLPITEEHVEYARSAYRRFGKGRHHAGLNYGDCFSYAAAVALNEPLLSVGSDFSKTDVASA